MSNCNTTATPLKTGAKLKKEAENKFVCATLYKQIIRSLRYVCNISLDILSKLQLVK